MKKRLIILIFQKISLILGLLILVLFFVPMMFGIMPYIVLSGSMEPEIKTGSVAYIDSNVKTEEIAKGDIIGFTTKEGQVTHRVVKINEDGSFVTKGDNNEEEDSQPVPVDKIKGKTVFSIPVLGRLVAFVKTKQGICFVCVYIFLNALCIIFDKKIYNDEIPSSFKEAIMKCESLEEIKQVIIEEMDNFKYQIIEDVSNVDLKQLGQQNNKLLPIGKIEKNNIEEKSKEAEITDIEIENLLNRIDLVDEEEIDLDKVKSEVIGYDNPKLRELRDNLKKNIESFKIITIDKAKKELNENNKVEKNASQKKAKKIGKKNNPKRNVS